MSTWTENELTILRQQIEDRAVLSKQNLEQIQQLLPGRSVAAIKKKSIEIRNGPPDRPKTAKWSEEEKHRLARAYKQRPEKLSTARIRAILEDFPGRSQKAIATKLREKFPAIYYMWTTDSTSESSGGEPEGESQQSQRTQNEENQNQQIEEPLPGPSRRTARRENTPNDTPPAQVLCKRSASVRGIKHNP